ncbi:uncharacterized protein Pyn_38984 [Prunus yedoensis var. nudiflora]|uniref:INO80 complex subunit B-like conserved region domain-containing protein n=1 Tax=Prunus yedoensis var. nudiflora TaxID=2094558 RepID=A0A314ZB78_PRUYE|nr:uncharacterized protein Pyn_38984 [Prunus yedoensis var. nudiflora]
MENISNSHRLDSISNAVRRKRSQTFRRPRPDSQPYNELHDQSSLSSATPSDDRARSSEGVLAPANWKSTSIMKDGLISESRSADAFDRMNGESPSTRLSGLDGFGNENKVKKVKLKVGGVTRTIQANSAFNGTAEGGSSTKTSRLSDVSRQRQKPNLPENSDDNQSPSDKKSGLKGIPWKDFSRSGFSLGRDNCSMGRISGKNTSGKEGDRSEPVRKSKRCLRGVFLMENLEMMKRMTRFGIWRNSKHRRFAGYREDDEESSKKHRKLSAVSNIDNAGASRSGKDLKKKSRTDRASGDTDYEEDEDSLSDGELEEQKGKLSDVEQQLKKAEAAQRRRMQVEKAARESEAEAIRKILGQDSSRKKREDKIKKRQKNWHSSILYSLYFMQEKAANMLTLPSNSIRYVMGPTGTVVIFSNDMGLPSLFDSKPCSYPPLRENCAGPSCTNPYKYRDSKSKLPLCSLKCYKAIQEKMQA